MDGRTQGALMLAIGGVAIRLAASGSALNFIRATYVPLLAVSGVVVAVLGAATLWRALTGVEPAHPDEEGQDHGHGHDHERGPRIAWMLAAPLFSVLLIAPPPLGSFAANRQSGIVADTRSAWPDLPAPVDGAIPLGLGDYASRALYDTDLSLAGERLRLTGFVSEVTDDGFVLTRFALSCCAADGTAIDVEVRTPDPAPAVDQWVEVVGSWRNRPDHAVGELTADPPLIDAQSLRPIPQPAEPYET